MAHCQPVTRAWLVCKNLREFAYRRCYLLFVELPGLADEDRHHLCRHLETALDLPGQALAPRRERIVRAALPLEARASDA